MNEQRVFEVLLLVKSSTPVSSLTRRGYQFHQIFQWVEEALEAGLIEFVNEQLVLTEGGYAFIRNAQDSYPKKSKPDWLTVLKMVKLDSRDVQKIYLPNRKTARRLNSGR